MPRPRKSSYAADKPPYSYVALCAMAIHSSPAKMMTLSEIYKFIVDNFPFYRKNSTRWQNSLRHNLSFNDCFVKICKTSEHGGKGNYWTLHSKCAHMFQDGSFLRRKRRFLSQDDDPDDKSVAEKKICHGVLNHFSNILPPSTDPAKSYSVNYSGKANDYNSPIIQAKQTRKSRTFTIDDILNTDDRRNKTKFEQKSDVASLKRPTVVSNIVTHPTLTHDKRCMEQWSGYPCQIYHKKWPCHRRDYYERKRSCCTTCYPIPQQECSTYVERSSMDYLWQPSRPTVSSNTFSGTNLRNSCQCYRT